MPDADVEPVPCRECGTPITPNYMRCEDCDLDDGKWEFAPLGPF